MTVSKDSLAEAIAVSLNVEREAAGWTLEALATELGLSEQTLGRYLTRRSRSLPVDVLTRACAAIGVPVGDVVERAEKRLASRQEDVTTTAWSIVEQARADVRANEAPPGESTSVRPADTVGGSA